MCVGHRPNPQLPHEIKSYLNVSFWNIHAQISKLIGDKFLDRDFLNKLSDSHVVGLSELHSLKPVYQDLS